MHLTSGGADCDAAHPGTPAEVHSLVDTDLAELAIVCNAFDKFDVAGPTGDWFKTKAGGSDRDRFALLPAASLLVLRRCRHPPR